MYSELSLVSFTIGFAMCIMLTVVSSLRIAHHPLPCERVSNGSESCPDVARTFLWICILVHGSDICWIWLQQMDVYFWYDGPSHCWY